MTLCQNCGREIGSGSVCPYCGVLATQPPLVVSGSVQTELRHAATSISASHIIVAINVLVFVLMVLRGVSPINPTSEQLKHWGANWGPLSLGSQPWRMLTANYVHGGFLHLALNMWCLWNLGQLTERILGRLNFVILYTLCGLAGSIASLWWHPMVVGVGASGAIFGLAGAAIAVFYLGHLPVARTLVRRMMRPLLAFVGYNLLFGLAPGVDNSAHIGGLVAGAAIGAAISKHVLVAPEVRRLWAGVTWLAMAVLLLVSYNGVRRAYPQLPLLANPQALAAQQVALARRALLQQRPAEAIPLLLEAIDSAPQAAPPRYLLGEAYLMLRKPNEAIPSFQEALRLDPEYAEAAAGLGTAYLMTGDKEAAAKAFQKAAELGYEGD